MSTSVESFETGRYPIPGRLNLLIAMLQLVAFGGIVYGASVATAWWHLLVLAAAFAIVGNSIYSIVHEAEHGLLHRSPKVNDGVGIIMSLLFPAPFHLIRQGHLGHHQRNRSDDEAFDLYFDGDLPVIRWIVLYGILTGFYWMIVVLSNLVVVVCPAILRRRFFEFDRPSSAVMESLNPKYWVAVRLEGLAAVLLHVFIVWSLDIPLINYGVVYFGFGFSWSAMQYVHHFGTQRHVLRGARNLWLFAPIDWIWLHHNWHLIHHSQPTVPWIYLPTLGRQSGDSRRTFLLVEYIRMWRGPRYTNERVENKFAGKIIQ